MPGGEAMQVPVIADSQHEILLPAGLAASDSDSRAFDILHLQGHVGVEFLCGSESRCQGRDQGRPPHPVSLPKLSMPLL